MKILFAAGLALAVHAAPLRAQQTDTIARRPTFTPLRVAKWSTLAATAAAAAYGFRTNRAADREYEAIERLCDANRSACVRIPNGAYVDAALESRYQSVLSRDHSARTALVASQIGIAAAVIMFVVDLRDDRLPDNIPFEPRSLQLVPGRDGSLQLRLSLPLAVDKR